MNMFNSYVTNYQRAHHWAHPKNGMHQVPTISEVHVFAPKSWSLWIHRGNGSLNWGACQTPSHTKKEKDLIGIPHQVHPRSSSRNVPVLDDRVTFSHCQAILSWCGLRTSPESDALPLFGRPMDHKGHGAARRRPSVFFSRIRIWDLHLWSTRLRSSYRSTMKIIRIACFAGIPNKKTSFCLLKTGITSVIIPELHVYTQFMQHHAMLLSVRAACVASEV